MGPVVIPSRTDAKLTERAAPPRPRWRRCSPATTSAWCSPARHRAALDTARLAGFGDCEVDADLHEWSYGDVEGLTTAQIRERGPEWAHWTVWTGPLPNGETVDDVAERARRILAHADASAGDVLLFGHGHQLRDSRGGRARSFDPAPARDWLSTRRAFR